MWAGPEGLVRGLVDDVGLSVHLRLVQIILVEGPRLTVDVSQLLDELLGLGHPILSGVVGEGVVEVLLLEDALEGTANITV